MVAVPERGSSELVFEGVDASLKHPLVLPGSVVLRVFAQVAQGARRRDTYGYLDHLGVLHSVQVGLELLIAFPGDGDAFNGHSVSTPVKEHGTGPMAVALRPQVKATKTRSRQRRRSCILMVLPL